MLPYIRYHKFTYEAISIVSRQSMGMSVQIKELYDDSFLSSMTVRGIEFLKRVSTATTAQCNGFETLFAKAAFTAQETFFTWQKYSFVQKISAPIAPVKKKLYTLCLNFKLHNIFQNSIIINTECPQKYVPVINFNRIVMSY